MKSVFVFAGIVGVVLACAIYYSVSKAAGSRQVMNVEDGFPVPV